MKGRVLGGDVFYDDLTMHVPFGALNYGICICLCVSASNTLGFLNKYSFFILLRSLCKLFF